MKVPRAAIIFDDTPTWPLVLIMEDASEPGTYTAFGAREIEPKPGLNADCCYEGGADLMIQHGATWSPKEGTPAHRACFHDPKHEMWIIPTSEAELYTAP